MVVIDDPKETPRTTKGKSIPEKRINVLKSVISDMIKARDFSSGDIRWPRKDIWRSAVETYPKLFPNNESDQREGVFAKAYNTIKKDLAKSYTPDL